MLYLGINCYYCVNNSFIYHCYTDDKPIAKIFQRKGRFERYLDAFDYTDWINQCMRKMIEDGEECKMVTIVVPLYNAEKYLDECLKCLITQTYSDIEIILVNDGSTDRTLDICEAYRKEDTRIRIINQNNSGVSSARNRGVAEASGEYITFVDGDDTVSLELVEKLLAASKLFSADFVFSGINLIDLHGNIEKGQCATGERKVEKNLLLSKFFTDSDTKLMLYGPYNKLFSRELAASICFDTDLKIGEDLLYVYRAITLAEGIAECSDCLYNYVKRENSATTQKFNIKKLDYLSAAERIVELSTMNKDAYLCACKWYYSNVLDFCRLIASDRNVKKQEKDRYNQYLKHLKSKRKEMWNCLSTKKKLSYLFLMYCPIIWICLKKIGYNV